MGVLGDGRQVLLQETEEASSMEMQNPIIIRVGLRIWINEYGGPILPGFLAAYIAGEIVSRYLSGVVYFHVS